jgi:hypothetical protein
MSVTVTTVGRVPDAAWDQQAMDRYATLARSRIVLRVQEDGTGDDDRPLKPYSTTPITVAFASTTGRRLKPKGGEPAYGRGTGDGSNRGPSGRVVAKHGWTFIFRPEGVTGDTGRKTRGPIIGRHYRGGYAQFKRESRRGVTGAVVDLTLSGQMLRQYRVIRVSRYSAEIGMTGQSRMYGPFTDAKRPWVGLSPGDVRALAPDLVACVEGAMARASRGAR